jgi:tetratricopeptide (TPR) repeat protein
MVAKSDAEDHTIITNARLAVELREAVGDLAAAGDSLNLLGSIYQCRKEYAEAEGCFKKSLEHRKRVLSRFHPDLGQVSVSLGNLYIEMGDYAEA